MSSSPYIPIVAANAFFDATGNPLSGTLRIVPSSASRLSSVGQVLPDPITRQIVAGSLTAPLQLADPSQTSPQGIGYTFTLTDKEFVSITWENVLVVADPVTGAFDLAQLNTGLFLPAVPKTVLGVGAGTSDVSSGVVTLATGATVSQNAFLSIASGAALAASTANPADFGMVVGIALSGAVGVSSVAVQDSGVVTFSGWNWTPGLVYLGTDGMPTQSPVLSGFIQAVGVALTATRLLVSLQNPIEIQ